MRCILCDRPMASAAITLQGKAGTRVIGPKCAKKAGLLQPKPRKVKVQTEDRCAKTVDWVREVETC